MVSKTLPIGIIGAGPIGLAAAAHLSLRNESFLLFESGDTVASNILSWKQVRVFSPWRYNVDKASKQLLINSGWSDPDSESLPTGRELFEKYLYPLSQLPAIKPFLHLNSKVIAIGRKNQDKMKDSARNNLPFVMQVQQEHGVEQYEVRAIIDASGTWQSPNPLGSGGVYAIGETKNNDRIFYGIPDITGDHKQRYANKNVLVVGSGHSSINTVLELDSLKQHYPLTQINWIMRKRNVSDIYGGQEKDALEARGALGIKIQQLIEQDRVNVYTPFQIQEIIREEKLTIIGVQNEQKFALPGIDEIISNTGSRPDFSFLREIRLDIDNSLESAAAIAELIDPNIHSCGTVRPHGELELRHTDKDFYIVGAKSYGRAPTFLMATGYEQVRSVTAALAGDMVAARNVELDLPETGVCNSDLGGGACCGTSATATVSKPQANKNACCL